MRRATTIRSLVAGLALSAASLVPVAPAVAADLLTRQRLPVEAAYRAAAAAIMACEAKGHAVSAAVVDVDGGIHVVLRGDRAGIQTVQSAIDKATTSAVFGIDSSVWVDKAAKGEEISPLLNQLPHLILARGGLVVRVGDEVVGGIAIAGAPGGRIDEACARVGADVLQQTFKTAGRALPRKE